MSVGVGNPLKSFSFLWDPKYPHAYNTHITMTEQYCMNLTHDDPPTEHLTYSYILCVNWAHAAASLALNVLLMYRTLPLSPVSSFLMWLTRPKRSLRWRFVIKKPRQCMKKQVQALCSWIFSSDSVQQVVDIFFLSSSLMRCRCLTMWMHS